MHRIYLYLTLLISLSWSCSLNGLSAVEAQYWRELDLSPSLLSSLDASYCLKNERTFIGCMAAYNSLLSRLDPSPARIPDLRQGPQTKLREFQNYWSRAWRSGAAHQIQFAPLQERVMKEVMPKAGIERSPWIAAAINSLLHLQYDPHTRWVPSRLLEAENSRSDQPVDGNVAASVFHHRNRRYGFIRIDSFYPEKTCELVRSSMDQLQQSGIEGWVLDLRRNPGGRVDQAICVLGFWIGRNRVGLITKYLPDYKRQTVTLTRQKQKTNLPMVTLIDSYSASAAEIVAGDLQDYQRSYLLGTRSFGKGTLQSLILSEDIIPGVKEIRTVGRFYVAGQRAQGSRGERTNFLVGIEPDIELPSRPDASARSEFLPREEHLYADPPYPEDGRWIQPRPQEIEALKKCMGRTGIARHQFARTRHLPIPADYQLLSAGDLLFCQTSL